VPAASEQARSYRCRRCRRSECRCPPADESYGIPREQFAERTGGVWAGERSAIFRHVLKAGTVAQGVKSTLLRRSGNSASATTMAAP
jgi:hypothetical protein